MGNTYTQIHIHAVFAVKNRTALLSKEWRDRFYQYMGCIIKDQGHKVLAIGGTSNHVHLFFGLHPSQSLSSVPCCCYYIVMASCRRCGLP